MAPKTKKPGAVQAVERYLEPSSCAPAVVVLPRKIKKPPRPPRGKVKRRLTVVGSDMHHPKVDPVAWSIFLQAVRDLKPDSLWILGDFVDFASVSVHERSPGDERLTLKVELEAGNRALDELDEVATHAYERMYFDGNHDQYRLDRYVASGRCPGILSDMIPTLPQALHLRERGYRYIRRDEQPFRTGDLHVLHGEFYGTYHAAKHLQTLGVNVLYGHTHRPQSYTMRRADGPIVATALPCLRLLQREWTHMMKVHEWVHGFGVIPWVDGVIGFPTNVYIRDGVAAYGEFRWRAQERKTATRTGTYP